MRTKDGVMKTSLVPALVAATSLAAFSLGFDSKAQASEWGCQVILCLSNPGGPTQFAECRPPIHKLWRHLAKGRSFPACSGVGFQSSRPGYEPYYCNEGFSLAGSFGPEGQSATCVSTSVQPVDVRHCSTGSGNSWDGQGAVVSPRWQRVDGRFQCVAQILTRPNIRAQPRYIDVTIEGAGRQRVWF